ncbi:MAG: diacylglycerol kinase [Gammaproteobacteria bacterium]
MRNKFLGIGEPGYHPLHKVQAILSGLRYAVLHDSSVLYKVVLSAVILVWSVSLHAWLDTAVIILATGVALAAELFNTAVEALCDFVEVRQNEKIRMIKDIAAAAAGVAILAWAVVIGAGFIEMWPWLMAWWSD